METTNTIMTDILVIGTVRGENSLDAILMRKNNRLKIKTLEKAMDFRDDILMKPPALILFDSGSDADEKSEIYRKLKSDPAAKHIPVVAVLPEGSSENDKRAILKAGVEAFFVRPIDEDQLSAFVMMTLRLTESQEKRASDELEEKLRRTESELKKKELFYHALFETKEYLFFTCDENARILSANQRGAAIFGFTPDTIVGRSFFDLRPDRAGIYRDIKDRVLANYETVQIETLYSSPDGDKWLLVTVSPIKLLDETRFQIVSQDITGKKLAEDKVQETLRLLRETQRIGRLGGWEYDVETGTNSWTEEIYNICGASDDFDLRDLTEITGFFHPDDREFVSKAFFAAVEAGIPFDLQARLTRLDGREIWARAIGRPVVIDGHVRKVQGNLVDITDYKKVETTLRQNEIIFEAFLENTPVYTFFKDNEIRSLRLSRSYEKMLGMPLEKAIGKTMDELFPSELSRSMIADDKRTLEERRTTNVVEEFNGRIYETLKFPIFVEGQAPMLAGFTVDITERKEAEEKLVAALNEKAVLLQELYHRTRNNMQVIGSLVALHAARSDDLETRKVLTDIENRIRSMALVHQKLYQSNDLSRINLKEYVVELAELLFQSLRDGHGKIVLDSNMEDIHVLIDVAVPCGLILNELLTNSIKYAFPDGREGRIRIQAERTGQGEITIRYGDTGVGLPPGFDYRQSNSLGLYTVVSIVEHQLGGDVVFGTDGGMSCTIRIRDDVYQDRIRDRQKTNGG